MFTEEGGISNSIGSRNLGKRGNERVLYAQRAHNTTFKSKLVQVSYPKSRIQEQFCSFFPLICRNASCPSTLEVGHTVICMPPVLLELAPFLIFSQASCNPVNTLRAEPPLVSLRSPLGRKQWRRIQARLRSPSRMESISKASMSSKTRPQVSTRRTRHAMKAQI